MANFEQLPKTIEACDYCECFRAVTVETTIEGDVLYICDECYPIFADRYTEKEEESKKFKWQEI